MTTKFDKLEEKIYKEYIRKGYSQLHARLWARATAGKVYREKLAKRR
jgi:hypothetical protein